MLDEKGARVKYVMLHMPDNELIEKADTSKMDWQETAIGGNAWNTKPETAENVETAIKTSHRNA
jgi:hypothetical protein